MKFSGNESMILDSFFPIPGCWRLYYPYHDGIGFGGFGSVWFGSVHVHDIPCCLGRLERGIAQQS
jgi:hypothetical protein